MALTHGSVVFYESAILQAVLGTFNQIRKVPVPAIAEVEGVLDIDVLPGYGTLDAFTALCHLPLPCQVCLRRLRPLAPPCDPHRRACSAGNGDLDELLHYSRPLTNSCDFAHLRRRALRSSC